jgi:hypothetical protein
LIVGFLTGPSGSDARSLAFKQQGIKNRCGVHMIAFCGVKSPRQSLSVKTAVISSTFCTGSSVAMARIETSMPAAATALTCGLAVEVAKNSCLTPNAAPKNRAIAITRRRMMESPRARKAPIEDHRSTMRRVNQPEVYKGRFLGPMTKVTYNLRGLEDFGKRGYISSPTTGVYSADWNGLYESSYCR